MLHLIRRSLSILKHTKISFSTRPVCNPRSPCDRGTQITILDNGIRVATEHQPTPLSCMALFIEAGSRFETAYNNGITHFLEHMAYKGYVGMNKCQLEQTLLYNGAKMTAKTTREIQSFTATFASESAAPFIFDTLSAIVTNMKMDCCEIEYERNNILLETVDVDNDPKIVTFDYLHQAAFQGTPLAQRVVGPSWNLQKFDSDIACNYMCQHYQPYKLCFATSGNVQHEDVVRMAEIRLSHIYGNPDGQSDDGPCRFTGSQIIFRDDSMPFAHVAIAFEAPGINNPEYIPLLVASRIIGKWHKSQGGGLGNASLLARVGAIDDKCESFESFYIAYRDIGLWGVYFVCKRLDIEDMVEAIQSEWMNLCLTVQRTDLERAVSLLKLEFARDICGVVNSCRDIGLQLMYACTRKSLEDKYYALSKVKDETVANCTEKILYDRCPVVAAVGPTEALPDYTRIRAGQYWLRF